VNLTFLFTVLVLYEQCYVVILSSTVIFVLIVRDCGWW